MARLPIPGQDTDQWGALLNEFLGVAHRSDGKLRGTYQVANILDYGAVPDGQIDSTQALKDAIARVARRSRLCAARHLCDKQTRSAQQHHDCGGWLSSILKLRDNAFDALFTKRRLGEWESTIL